MRGGGPKFLSSKKGECAWVSWEASCVSCSNANIPRKKKTQWNFAPPIKSMRSSMSQYSINSALSTAQHRLCDFSFFLCFNTDSAIGAHFCCLVHDLILTIPSLLLTHSCPCHNWYCITLITTHDCTDDNISSTCEVVSSTFATHYRAYTLNNVFRFNLGLG